MTARALLPLLALVAAAPAAAQTADGAGDGGAAPAAAAAPRAGAVVLDGIPDEEAWGAAAPLSGFVQREPDEGRPASERTEVRFLYDAEALWVGAWLWDSQPDATVLGETRRDASLEQSDALLLVFDTYLDRQNGFVFGTTPAGIEYDGQVIKEGEGGGGPGQRQQRGSGGGFNLNWDGSWEVATSRDGRGWYAEFRIPFSTLRYDGGGPQRWGVNVARRIRRRNEEVFWAPVPRQHDLYRVSRAGLLSGFDAPARRIATVTPYVLGSTRRDYHGSAGTEWHGDFGGDAKLGITPSLTLDLTANTDFAQVEVDDEQVNLTRFDLFFPEKRPFFLENAGTFAVGTPRSVELFFSRRIGIADDRAVPILGGGRVTGKVGGVTVGLLDIQTEGVRNLAPANNYGAVRALRELPGRSRVGATFVSRVNTEDADDHNLTWGVDGQAGVGDDLTFDGYLAGTRTPGLPGREHAWSVSGSWEPRDWTVAASFREVGDGFNPEVGFLPRRAYRYYSGRILRRVRFESVPWFRELRPHVSFWEFRDLEGFSETRLVHIDSHFEFSNGAFFQLPAVNFTREGLQEPFEIAEGVIVAPGTYDHLDWGFRFNSDLSAPFSVEGQIDLGGFYGGTRYGAESTLHVRPNDRLVTAFRVGYNDVRLPVGDFTTTLVSLRAAYSFTPSIYLQSLVQYTDVTEDVSVNLRFGWLATAGTGLFVVFNDLEHAGSLQRTGIPRGPVDRTLVVKFTRRLDLSR